MARLGNRRIDRVLDDAFVTDLDTIPMAELRRRRADAEQEETDLSYVRRLLQGRSDILRAELARRSGDGGSVMDSLAGILAEGPVPAAHGSGRYTSVEPSRADSHRRHVEAMVADVDLSDLAGMDDEALQRTARAFAAEEERASKTRRDVQAVMDACTAEIGRRYRDGLATVSDLLPSESA